VLTNITLLTLIGADHHVADTDRCRAGDLHPAASGRRGCENIMDGACGAPRLPRGN